MRSVLFLARNRIGGNAASFKFILFTKFWSRSETRDEHDKHAMPWLPSLSFDKRSFSSQKCVNPCQKPALSPLDLEQVLSGFHWCFDVLESTKSFRIMDSFWVMMMIMLFHFLTNHEISDLIIWNSVPGSNWLGTTCAGCQRDLFDLVQHPESCLNQV